MNTFKPFGIYRFKQADGTVTRIKFGKHALDYFSEEYCKMKGDEKRLIDRDTFVLSLMRALVLDKTKTRLMHPDKGAVNHYVKFENGDEIVVAFDDTHYNDNYDLYLCNVIRNTANKNDMRNRINKDFRRIYKEANYA